MKHDKDSKICPISNKSCHEAKNCYITNLNGDFDFFKLCSKCSINIRQEEILKKEQEQKIKKIRELLLRAKSNIKDDLPKKNKKEYTSSNLKVCPECNVSLDSIIKKQKVGCNSCFTYFKEEIEIIMELAYGSKEHLRAKGKNSNDPKDFFEFEEIKTILKDNYPRLNSLMNDAAHFENYELAAQIRDYILELKKCLEKSIILKNEINDISKKLSLKEASIDFDRLTKNIENLENKYLELKAIHKLSKDLIRDCAFLNYKK
jgi:protein-arginine kinase activator protein McsA